MGISGGGPLVANLECNIRNRKFGQDLLWVSDEASLKCSSELVLLICGESESPRIDQLIRVESLNYVFLQKHYDVECTVPWRHSASAM